MKKLVSLLIIAAAVACDPVAVGSVSSDPCEYQTYQSPACGGGGYEWTSGYYNSAHIWIVPHYRRVYVSPRVYSPGPVLVTRPVVRPVTTIRTTIVAPRPNVIVPRTVVAPRPTVLRSTVRYAPTVTRSNTRPSISVTRTRIR